MFADSHCHLDFKELFDQITLIRSNMKAQQVTHALCISVEPQAWPSVLSVANLESNWYASIGVHPDYELEDEVSVAQIVQQVVQSTKVKAIGETGLDYYRRVNENLDWQRVRFRTHIRAALETGLPLVVHTRNSAHDTIQILKEESAHRVGGVLHCFTESWEVAEAAMEMGFYLSISGIITFKNSVALKEVVQKIPMERLLIETDSPYLAPVPYRGKLNQPSFVPLVAEEIARLKNLSIQEVGQVTMNNFLKLFQVPHESA